MRRKRRRPKRASNGSLGLRHRKASSMLNKSCMDGRPTEGHADDAGLVTKEGAAPMFCQLRTLPTANVNAGDRFPHSETPSSNLPFGTTYCSGPGDWTDTRYIHRNTRGVQSVTLDSSPISASSPSLPHRDWQRIKPEHKSSEETIVRLKGVGSQCLQRSLVVLERRISSSC